MIEKITEFPFFKSSGKRRIAAFIIDHFILTFSIVLIIFLALGPNFIDNSNPGPTMVFVMIPGFILYFAKDSFKGVSVGRWIMGIMVRDESDPNEIPSFGRLFLRNLFIIIWPIEFIFLATSDTKKRLGDKIAKTIVVKNPIKPTNLPRILALIAVGALFFIFIFFTVGTGMKNSDAYKVAISEIEKNEKILSETGGIKGYGFIPTGNISVSDGQGQAELEIKVVGTNKNVNIFVYLEKQPDGQWELIEMQH